MKVFAWVIILHPNWVKQGVPLEKFDFTWEYRLVVIFLFIIGNIPKISMLKIRSSNLVSVLIWYWEIKITISHQIKSESTKYKKCHNRRWLDTFCNPFFSNWRVVMLRTVLALVFHGETKGFYEHPVDYFYSRCNRKSNCNSITSSKSSCNLWKIIIISFL